MSSIVARGDTERFCLSADPTCTGINPCRVCWETVRDNILPAAMRAANCTTTPNQVMGFIREHFMGWVKLLDAAQRDRPDLFAKIAQMRQPALDREWADASQRGSQPPLTPFGAVVLKVANAMTSPPVPNASIPMAQEPPMNQSPIPQGSPMQSPEWPPDHFDDELPLARGDVKSMVKNGSRSSRKKDNFSGEQLVNGASSNEEDSVIEK